MEILPSGSTAILVELDDLDAVLALYAALSESPPAGVVDIVPAARTVLLIIDPEVTDLGTVATAVRGVKPRPGLRGTGESVEIPVIYDGEDLADVGEILGCSAEEVVERHSGTAWTVAFCGFAPGFGYMTAEEGEWAIPRRSAPRTKVPAGSVALAGEFSGLYPRQSPGGWQLIGHTTVAAFDIDREPAALLRPGVQVRFVPVEQ